MTDILGGDVDGDKIRKNRLTLPHPGLSLNAVEVKPLFITQLLILPYSLSLVTFDCSRFTIAKFRFSPCRVQNTSSKQRIAKGITVLTYAFDWNMIIVQFDKFVNERIIC